MEQEYAGRSWLLSQRKIELSKLGEAVADVLGAWGRGIYHFSPVTLNADWGSQYIEIKIDTNLSAYRITELLVICESKNINANIMPHTFKYLKIGFRFMEVNEKGIFFDIEAAKKFIENNSAA